MRVAHDFQVNWGGHISPIPTLVDILVSKCRFDKGSDKGSDKVFALVDSAQGVNYLEKMAGSHSDRVFNRWVGVVADDFEIFETVFEDRCGLTLDDQFGQRPGFASELLAHACDLV